MKQHFHVEIQELKKTLVQMAGMVEDAIRKAIRSLSERDPELAREVIETDREIDRLEINLEDRCLLMLARYQPVAVDLRLILVAVKMNNDLERMGDHAVNIAEKASEILRIPALKPLVDIPYMAGIVQEMVRDSLDAFVQGDVEKAIGVCRRDDTVDALEQQINRELLTYVMEDPQAISRAIDLTIVAKNLERIADISTNICEEVIFMVEARTIKHHFGEGERPDHP
ncbi:MAG: phosphate signaling complex protein PhoU [Dehalococcoidia bacterium]